MNEITDYIYRLICHPSDALFELTKQEKIKTGLSIWLFVLALITLSTAKLDIEWIPTFLVLVLVSGMGIVIHSAVIDYIAGFMGGRGTAKGITVGFLSAYLPYAFVVFFILMKQLGWEAVSGGLTFLTWIWSVVLDVIAIRSNYEFTTTKSFWIEMAPMILFVVLFSAIILLSIIVAVIGGITVMTPFLENITNIPF